MCLYVCVCKSVFESIVWPLGRGPHSESVCVMLLKYRLLSIVQNCTDCTERLRERHLRRFPVGRPMLFFSKLIALFWLCDFGLISPLSDAPVAMQGQPARLWA